MLGQSGAIAKRPPHASFVDSVFRVYKTDIAAASTAAWTLFDADSIPFGGCWVTFVSSVDCYIIFYPSAAVPIAASATNGWPLMAGVEYNWWCDHLADNTLAVIRAGTDNGVLSRYRSNL